MRKRTSTRRTKKSLDVNQMAAEIVRLTTLTRGNGKDPLAQELGRRGGLKGGRARAEKLSPGRRTEIASNAARKRWADKSAKSAK